MASFNVEVFESFKESSQDRIKNLSTMKDALQVINNSLQTQLDESEANCITLQIKLIQSNDSNELLINDIEKCSSSKKEIASELSSARVQLASLDSTVINLEADNVELKTKNARLEEEIVQMEAEQILSNLERDRSHELSYHELLSRFIALEACIGEEKAKNAELEAILHQVLAN